MKKFVYITLGVIIVALMLKNVDVFKSIINVVTEQFGKAFAAVTKVEKF